MSDMEQDGAVVAESVRRIPVVLEFRVGGLVVERVRAASLTVPADLPEGPSFWKVPLNPADPVRSDKLRVRIDDAAAVSTATIVVELETYFGLPPASHEAASIVAAVLRGEKQQAVELVRSLTPAADADLGFRVELDCAGRKTVQWDDGRTATVTVT